MATTALNDDLFKESTMTFGEHLEELRSSLFRAVLALLVGFIIGLSIGDWVVRRIQDPLVAALEKYYKAQAVQKFDDKIAALKASGVTDIPIELIDRENYAKLIYEEQLLPQEYFLSTGDVIAALKSQYPKAIDTLPAAPKADGEQITKDKMLKTVPARAVACGARR